MNIDELDAEQLAHVLKKIEELQKNDGWIILKQIMASERERFFRKMAHPNASTDPAAIHYQRGVIESSYRMSELPDQMVVQLNNRLLLHSSAIQTPPPT